MSEKTKKPMAAQTAQDANPLEWIIPVHPFTRTVEKEKSVEHAAEGPAFQAPADEADHLVRAMGLCRRPTDDEMAALTREGR